MDDQTRKPLNLDDLEVTELEDEDLEGVTGGVGDTNPGCNPSCTNPGCNPGCPTPTQPPAS